MQSTKPNFVTTHKPPRRKELKYHNNRESIKIIHKPLLLVTMNEELQKHWASYENVKKHSKEAGKETHKIRLKT